VPADGGTARQLSRGSFHHGGGPGRGSGSPVWTPDSRHVLISANRRSDFELESRDTEIYEFDVATGTMRALTDRRGPDNSPAVSPDGRSIAYTGFDDRHQGYQVTRLYVMPRAGGVARVLGAELDRDVVNPQWTADGNAIVFQYDDRGNTKIGLVPAGGGAVRQLANNVGTGASAYSGGSYSVARNGRIAFTYTTPHVPSDVAVAGLREAGTRVVASLNHGLLAQRRLGQVEEIWYPSSKDDRRIHGWILKPPDFDSTRKYPLLLEIHGGPFANYGDRFDLEKQVWAAAGYVVLYTNPRGSTSYGEEFGNLIHHAYPGDDFHDLEAGVDAVIARGYIDPDQQFITGGSGGGVLTAWMIGRTTRFRAAVLQYPVINWYSFALSSDIPSTVNRYWFPGAPWENLQQYHARSVISLVGNVRTPSMIITGEADYRTPMSESEQYYQALRIAGVDAVLVKVPDEPHGIRRRPSHHLQKMAYIQGWLDLHRKSPLLNNR
jgi:acylaminoacyl-peptidase